MDERLDISAATMSTNDGPARVAIHGQAGTGKTMLACYFPKPFIIGAEAGIPRDLGFDVPIVRPRSWLQLLDVVASLTGDRHEYETAVIDTVDWVEPLLYEYILARDSGRDTEMNKKGKPLISIEDYGYGRGYLAAEEEFIRLLSALDVLQYRRRMHVVLLMHTIVRTFKNPSGPDFDRYEPKCHQRVSAKIVEWAENFLFLHFRRDAGKISEDKARHGDHAKAKGVEGVAERLVGCQDSALFDAKNRVRMPPVVTLTDPNIIVSQLLGDHLGRNVKAVADRASRTSIAHGAADGPTIGNDPAGAQRFLRSVEPHIAAMANGGYGAPARGEPEPARSADYVSRDDRRQLDRSGHDERTAAMDQGRFADAAGLAMPREGYGNHDARVAPSSGPVGVPAHHESRAADEKARQEDAFARARGAVEERDARRSAEPKTQAPPAGATSNGGGAPARNAAQRASTASRFDQDNDLMRRLAEAVARGQSLGPQYRADMVLWQERAADDAKSSRADKLERIIAKINRDADAAVASAQP